MQLKLQHEFLDFRMKKKYISNSPKKKPIKNYFSSLKFSFIEFR